MKIKFCAYKLICGLLILSIFTPLYAQELAITIDNPNVEKTALFSSEVRDKKILATLSKNQLKIVLFVQGAQVNNPDGRKLLNLQVKV